MPPRSQCCFWLYRLRCKHTNRASAEASIAVPSRVPQARLRRQRRQCLFVWQGLQLPGIRKLV